MLLFCIAVGTLASVLFDDDGAAFVFMALFVACTSLAVPIPYYLGKGAGRSGAFFRKLAVPQPGLCTVSGLGGIGRFRAAAILAGDDGDFGVERLVPGGRVFS